MILLLQHRLVGPVPMTMRKEGTNTFPLSTASLIRRPVEWMKRVTAKPLCSKSGESGGHYSSSKIEECGEAANLARRAVFEADGTGVMYSTRPEMRARRPTRARSFSAYACLSSPSFFFHQCSRTIVTCLPSLTGTMRFQATWFRQVFRRQAREGLEYVLLIN
jgi:hypothetical protein